MPIVHIQLLEGRSEEQVKELIRTMTETIAATLDSPIEKIRIIVTEIPKTHWGIGGTPVSDISK